ncbi:hypothetical protein HBH70_077020 [Parastagonospora nodorum]|nr:hypothetical protein HBI09_164810 [Parastagonospora nodorum]KAH4173671.1 hypothetical protein HBH43_080860 [Parastagonospora nodorum]KAH4210011.1 hypothetical protein HBI95_069080 [Parastagonospora nodorum]KAH4848348.1 hypothetical protein HBH75_153430 [Parastagonospora nodorum]KAH5005649.1 hypothetical protein HBI77_114890 [Parastagonospora nodorum]
MMYQRKAKVEQKEYLSLSGRHGAIKPTNILWFPDLKSTNGYGTLKLSYFATTRFSNDGVIAVYDEEPELYSKTYEAPESSMPNGRLSSKCDVWALGCVFLEFVSWYFGGHERIQKFERERSADYLNSSFFFIKVEGNPPSISAELKPVVVKMIARLQEDRVSNSDLQVIIQTVLRDMLITDQRRKSMVSITRHLEREEPMLYDSSSRPLRENSPSRLAQELKHRPKHFATDYEKQSWQFPESAGSGHSYIQPDPDYNLGAVWKDVRDSLPYPWKLDLQYDTAGGGTGRHGAWTCRPMDPDRIIDYPLSIAGAPIVIPVQHRWPPMAGVAEPPDPRRLQLIDCNEAMPLETVRDIFLTFEHTVGFYLLINGLLQLIVPKNFDTEWAALHYPHRFGGLKVSYILDTRVPTATTTATTTSTLTGHGNKGNPFSRASAGSNRVRPSKQPVAQSLQLNDFIEARPTKSRGKATRYSGRIGLQVSHNGLQCVIMSTHIITQAMIQRDRSFASLIRGRVRANELPKDWVKRAEIWARNDKVGVVERTFDPGAATYPNGFSHDISVIKPHDWATFAQVVSPISDLGWLSHKSWSSLCQRTSSLRILGPTGLDRTAKTLKSNLLSQVECIGKGIFRNQQESSGTKPDLRVGLGDWKDMISVALLYRVNPKFDPPYGYSGIALVADGVREDSTEGPGIVGFQSFVQHSDVTQVYSEDGGKLSDRLEKGVVAFYGAFEVPEQLKVNYKIL